MQVIGADGASTTRPVGGCPLSAADVQAATIGFVTAPIMFVLVQLRSRWRGWLGLALVVGLFAGAVDTIVAGAQRTDSAYPRLVIWSRAPDAVVYSPVFQSRTFEQVRPSQVSRLSQVTATAAAMTYMVTNPAQIGLIAPEDGRIPGQMWSRKLIAGRLPDPASPDEADIAFTTARDFKLGVGGSLSLSLLTMSGATKTVRLRVVGVDAAPTEFPPSTGTGNDAVWTTPAFYREHAGQSLVEYEAIAVRLRHGVADWTAIQHELDQLGHGRVLQAFTLADTGAPTQRSIHLQVVALRLLAVLLALIGLLVTCQLISRLTFLESDDYRTAQALGMTRRQLFAAAIGRAALIGAFASLVATVVAVALSPVFPIGLARFAEPHPGFDANAVLLAAAFAATMVGVAACAAWPAWRSVRRSVGNQPTVSRPTAGLISGLASGLRPASAAVGLRLALQRGSGRHRPAGGQHRGHGGRRPGGAHRRACLLREPESPAVHSPAVRGLLGCPGTDDRIWGPRPGRHRRCAGRVPRSAGRGVGYGILGRTAAPAAGPKCRRSRSTPATAARWSPRSCAGERRVPARSRWASARWLACTLTSGKCSRCSSRAGRPSPSPWWVSRSCRP